MPASPSCMPTSRRVKVLSTIIPVPVFFFSSRRRHTICGRDWSSDVCSSDLTTSFGLLVSTVTKTQIAAILGTMILTTLPTVQFSGLITPRSSLDGGAALMGVLFPAGYFLDIAVGTFTKALNLRDLWPQCLALLGFFLGFTGLSLILLKKQEA